MRDIAKVVYSAQSIPPHHHRRICLKKLVFVIQEAHLTLGLHVAAIIGTSLNSIHHQDQEELLFFTNYQVLELTCIIPIPPQQGNTTDYLLHYYRLVLFSSCVFTLILFFRSHFTLYRLADFLMFNLYIIYVYIFVWLWCSHIFIDLNFTSTCLFM